MALSPLLRFGTSTWGYEGWKGDVYRQTYAKNRFKQDCLAEYARYEYEGAPLFRTVGFDYTFYGPPTAQQLAHYASLLPVDFQVCAKVWEEITIPVYPPGLRYRAKGGPNPHFLDADYFLRQVLPPSTRPFSHTWDRSFSSFSAAAWIPPSFCRSSMHFSGGCPRVMSTPSK